MKITGTPPSKTLFIDDLDLGNGASRTTAVFCPKSYEVTAAPNAVVYLHGFEAPPIEQYLSGTAHPLREETNKSDPSDLLLIAPSLGPSSESGLFETNGLDWYLDEVLKRLAGTGLFTGTPALGEVYLAAHSGGGHTARRASMLITKGLQETPATRPKHTLAEVWLFDALYAPHGDHPSDKTQGANIKPLGDPDAVEEEWFEVIRTQAIRLTTVYATPEPTQRSLNLKAFVDEPLMLARSSTLAGSAVFVESTKTKIHEEVPKMNWRDVMDARG
jgi:hypothetical protein